MFRVRVISVWAMAILLNPAFALTLQNLSLPILPTPINETISYTNGASIDDWAKASRQDEWHQTPEAQHAIGLLVTVFEGKIASDRAAATIESLYNPLLKAGSGTSRVATFWVITCEAMRQLGYNHDIDNRLIDLFNAIIKLPDVTDQKGIPITPDHGWWGVFWRDLPVMAVTFREYAEDIDPSDPEPPDPQDYTDAQRATQMNVVTFGALYLNRGQRDIGMSRFAEFTFTHFQRLSYQTPEGQRAAKAEVPAAANWILLAGEKIYDLCKHGVPRYPGRDFDLPRWALWKGRFGEISAYQALSGDVRNFASRAATEMARIERLAQQS